MLYGAHAELCPTYKEPTMNMRTLEPDHKASVEYNLF